MELEEMGGMVRIPPHSEEAESNVIGLVMTDPTLLKRFEKDGLTPSDFYVPKHRLIWEAILAVSSQGGAPDLLGIKMTLKQKGKLDQAGGMESLTYIYDHTCTKGYAKFYANLVRQKSKLRALIEACDSAIEMAHSSDSADVIISKAKFNIHKITECEQDRESPEELVERLADAYETASATGRSGLGSRWFEVQKRIGVYPPGKMTLVGARPGQGKTTFALNEALDKAAKGEPVLIISIEMSRDELYDRAIGDLMGLDLTKFKDGTASKEERAAHRKGGKIVAKLPIYMEHGNFSVEQCCSLIRDYVESKKIKLAIIDYVQLVAPSEGKKFSNRNMELSWISGSLIRAGNETNIHLMVMSQLNRALMSGADKGEPELHHLRDSGTLEQDAYMVMFIFQDPNAKGEYSDNQPSIVKVAKHRGGPSPTRTMMVFQKSKQRFVGRDLRTLDAKAIEAALAPKKQQVQEEVDANPEPDTEDEVPF